MVIMHDRPSPSALAASVPVRLGKSFATKTVAAADQFYAFEYSARSCSPFDHLNSAHLSAHPTRPSPSTFYATIDSFSSSSSGHADQATQQMAYEGVVEKADEMECILIWDHKLKGYTLERLMSNVRIDLASTSLPSSRLSPQQQQQQHPNLPSSSSIDTDLDVDVEGESSDEEIRVRAVPPAHLRKARAGASAAGAKRVLSAAFVDDDDEDDEIVIMDSNESKAASASTKRIVGSNGVEDFGSLSYAPPPRAATLPRTSPVVATKPLFPTPSTIPPPARQHAASKSPAIVNPRSKAAASKKPAASKKLPAVSRKAPASKRPAPASGSGPTKKKSKRNSISQDGDAYRPPAGASAGASYGHRPNSFGAPSISRTAGKTLARAHQFAAVPAASSSGYLAHPPPSSGSGSGSDASSASDDDEDSVSASGSDRGGAAQPGAYRYSPQFVQPQTAQHYFGENHPAHAHGVMNTAGSHDDRASADDVSDEDEDEEDDEDDEEEMHQFASSINSQMAGGMGGGGKGRGGKGRRHMMEQPSMPQRRASAMSLNRMMN